jgi:arsenite methyltransferase
MSSTYTSSTGHEASAAGWLDLHFESARPEYEDALRQVGIQPGWHVLDAGCGGGSFLPLIAAEIGPTGSIAAIDLAPENITRARRLVDTITSPPNINTHVASVLALPFDDSTFDCVWSANVMQYLKPDEFNQAAREAGRVLKPDGLYVVKDFDSTLLQMLPIEQGMWWRFMTARLNSFREKGLLGTGCGSALPAMLRQAGFNVIWRKGWMVERWAPVSEETRSFVRDFIGYFAAVAPRYDLPEFDQRQWRELAAEPQRLMNSSDFCYREFFVVTVCRV